MILYFIYALITVVVLTAITNIVVNVTKKIVSWNKFPTQVWVFIVSMVLAYLALFIACSIFNITIVWYYYVATAIIGFFVCYAAIFGYDNLYSYVWQTVKQIKQIISDFISSRKIE